MSNIRGLFIGITSVDIVYNSNEPLPNDNEKVIINDFEMKIGGPYTLLSRGRSFCQPLFYNSFS